MKSSQRPTVSYDLGMDKVRLDLGCGKRKEKGFTGVDIAPIEGHVDIVADLSHFPWPFGDNSVDQIRCSHFLTHHRDLVKAMAEIHRVLKPDGLVEIIAPHYASDNANTDPTHQNRFGYRTMNYFCTVQGWSIDYYTPFKFELISAEIRILSIGARLRVLNGILLPIEYAINRLPRIYERFFCYIFPPAEVVYRLRK